MTPKGKQQKRNRIPGVSQYTTPGGQKRWQVVFDIGDGEQRRQKKKRGCLTQQEAVDWRADYLAGVRRGEIVEPSKMLVRDYFEQWIAVKAARVRPSTIRIYHRLFRSVTDTIGATPLSRLTPTLLERTYAELAETYSPSTIRTLHRVLSMLGKAAVRDRLIPFNPCERIDAPGGASPERQAWTIEQARAFLAGCADDHYADVWHLLLETWLRNGEVRALRWSDIDFDAGTLTVARTFTIGTDNRATTGPPKSKASQRTVMLSPNMLARLRKRRHAQQVTAMQMGEGWSEDRWVFLTPRGGPLYETHLRSALIATCERVGVPYITVHGLRHTGGSLIYGAGGNLKVISERMGHSSMAITMGIYLHSETNQHNALAEHIAQLLDSDAV